MAYVRADLEQVEAQHKKLNRKSHAKAGMTVALGFVGCVTQLVGLGTGIYVIADWNEVEPITWMLCKLPLLFLVTYLFRVVLHDGWLLLLHEV